MTPAPTDAATCGRRRQLTESDSDRGLGREKCGFGWQKVHKTGPQRAFVETSVTKMALVIESYVELSKYH